MRVMGIDYGTKRIGVAISDGLMLTAQGQDSIVGKDASQVFDIINKLIKENDVGEIVVGLPVNMDGSHGPKATETMEFVEKLSKAVNLPVKTWDERLTSMQAERVMLEADMSRKKRRGLSDKLAATILLQNYLDFKGKGA